MTIFVLNAETNLSAGVFRECLLVTNVEQQEWGGRHGNVHSGPVSWRQLRESCGAMVEWRATLSRYQQLDKREHAQTFEIM